jgi:formylglycine-generating enzyme required for sulfatase activity
MSADVAARLRQLAHDHHDGRLDLAAYRSLRAPLLESLVLNDGVASAVLEVTQPRAVPKPAVHAANEPGRKRRPGGVVVIVGVVIVLAVGTAVWMFVGGGVPGRKAGDAGGDTAGAPDAANSAGSAATTARLDRILDLVGGFTERGDWSDGRLATLNAALLELGGVQTVAAAREARFQHFVDELRSRLKEQQALAAVPLTVDNSPLAALAVTVGIDLNSPDSALHVAPLPEPIPPESTTPGARGDVAPPGARRVAVRSPTPQVAGGTPGSPQPAGKTADVHSDSGGGQGAVTHSESDASASAVASTAPADTLESTCRLDLIRSRRPLCHDTLSGGMDGPLLALIPAGAFDMGSTAAPEEQPVHRVTIQQPFAVSVYEVSQGEFKQYCEHAKRPCAPQPWSGDDYPVVNVSWDDARAYTDWLSTATHHHYGLPTEAQWEYAARAGRTGLFPSGDALSPTDAQFSALTKQTTAARRSQSFNANAFRLLHTVGNVREWVEDGWTPNFAGAPSDGSAVKSGQVANRVVRGGSYTDSATRLRLSMREGLPVNTRDVTTGFRIVRELP